MIDGARVGCAHREIEMTSSNRGITFMLAVVLGGCAATAAGGAEVRTRTTTAAFERYSSTQGSLGERVERSGGGKESPRARACKSGNSKTCNELGDGLVIKHAESDAERWYAISCERVRGSMVANATSLMGLTQDLSQIEGESGAGANKRAAELKSEVSEIKARIQGCLDTGDLLKASGESKQSLKFYDAVCEFSTLVQAVSASMPSLETTTANACAAGERVRASLSGEPNFSPEMFVELTKPKKKAAEKKPTTSSDSEEGMVFSEADL